ncbi:Uncharacterized protein Rs2_14100 [Raphanus sativus]|nr:Uncharacterized protein Rs2_14100 [Raphanus sativus]
MIMVMFRFGAEKPRVPSTVGLFFSFFQNVFNFCYFWLIFIYFRIHYLILLPVEKMWRIGKCLREKCALWLSSRGWVQICFQDPYFESFSVNYLWWLIVPESSNPDATFSSLTFPTTPISTSQDLVQSEPTSLRFRVSVSIPKTDLVHRRAPPCIVYP